jgi:hypothetical protein
MLVPPLQVGVLHRDVLIGSSCGAWVMELLGIGGRAWVGCVVCGVGSLGSMWL